MVILRTSDKNDPNRNLQLAPHETQVEAHLGAVSVLLDPSQRTLRITTMRGWARRQAQCAELNVEQLDALIDLLQRHRSQMSP